MSSSQSRSFRVIRLLLPFVVLAAMLVMIRLGFWQLERRAQRSAYNERVASRATEPALRVDGPLGDPTQLEFRQARVEGTFDYDHEIIRIGGTRGDAPGVHLLTPLRIHGTDYAVLVDRGWIPYGEREPSARARFREADEATILGRILLPMGSTELPAPDSQPRRDAWARVDIAQIQRQVPYQLLPFYVEQLPQPGAADLPWRGREVTLGEGSHLSYAIQWFSFAAILLIGYVTTIVLSLRRSSSRLDTSAPNSMPSR
jgi:surfeit locus 1 family protein